MLDMEGIPDSNRLPDSMQKILEQQNGQYFNSDPEEHTQSYANHQTFNNQEQKESKSYQSNVDAQ